jgi:hypothetical protein
MGHQRNWIGWVRLLGTPIVERRYVVSPLRQPDNRWMSIHLPALPKGDAVH